jgi:transposase
MRLIFIYIDSEAMMAKPKKTDPKREALAKDSLLNPHPETVRDALFASNPFFDPDDLLQVRYEMVRRHKIDGRAISKVAADFGVSRPTFYKAEKAVKSGGLGGLVPAQRGPKGGHKLSEEVTAFAAKLKADSPEMTAAQRIEAIKSRFGIEVHRRSLERALTRKKKRLE